MSFKISFIVIAACIFSSCESFLLEENTSKEPIKNFEVLWKEFDLNYSYFEYKKVNWDSIYEVYRPLVTDKTSEKELFNILWQMTNTLKDGHVNIYSSFGNSYFNFKNGNAPTCNVISDSAMNKFFDNYKRPNNVFRYSKVKNKNIGYVKIISFGYPLSEYKYIDNIIKDFETTDGIIIDLRNNGGGSTNNSDEILGRFTDQKRLYKKVRYRNGPNHNDFTNWIDVYIEPSGNPYLKSIVVLINKGCFSTTEDCTLAFRELPHVRIIGDTTGGGSGNPIARELPNGWLYRFSNWQEVDSKNINYEGIGIPPDSVVWISKQDSINGIDRILETAINMIEKK